MVEQTNELSVVGGDYSMNAMQHRPCREEKKPVVISLFTFCKKSTFETKQCTKVAEGRIKMEFIPRT